MRCKAVLMLSGACALLLPELCSCSNSAAGVGTPRQSTAARNDSVQLSTAELSSVSVRPVGEHDFTQQRDSVGYIDFDQDRVVQVSPPYQGRILQLFADAGSHVRRGQLLFTIDSPDLVQAESTLISAAGTLDLTTRALTRARGLYAVRGLAQKDYEQAVSDQQSALAAYEGARNAARIFGKSEAQIDRILATQRVDASMPVLSPISGVVTARNAAPGTLVQPGGTPAPYSIADLASKWLIADMPETDLPALRLGQPVSVQVLAYPGRLFHGRISYIAEAVDPNTHRVAVRSQIADPHDELRAQMFATFTVQVHAPAAALAVPDDAVVREGDGTMTVWVANGANSFTRRSVTLGAEQDGYEQIVGGLRPGERIATTGALFISNAAVVGAAN